LFCPQRLAGHGKTCAAPRASLSAIQIQDRVKRRPVGGPDVRGKLRILSLAELNPKEAVSALVLRLGHLAGARGCAGGSAGTPRVDWCRQVWAAAKSLEKVAAVVGHSNPGNH
jgi:hypothetical protein